MLRYRRLFRGGDLAIATGIRESDWEIVALNEECERKWNRPIGSQYFETNLESVVVTSSPQWSAAAIVDSNGNVEIVSLDGELIARDFVSTDIRGIAWLSGSSPQLAIASKDGVQVYEIMRTPFRTVSGPTLNQD